MKGQPAQYKFVISAALLCMTLLSGCGKDGRESSVLEQPDPEQPAGVTDPRAHEDTSSLDIHRLENDGDIDMSTRIASAE